MCIFAFEYATSISISFFTQPMFAMLETDGTTRIRKGIEE